MPIDPEVAAEVAALKSKLLKLETELAGVTGAERTAVRKEIDDLKTALADVLGKISKPAIPPVTVPPTIPEKDPLAKFLDGDE